MYGKSFESMFEGSMVGAGINVFAVWSYIITKARRGIIEINPKLLAFTLGGSEKDVEAALEFLQQPDPESRSKEEGGRRLVREGQFQYRVVNFVKYRELRDEVDRREYNRVKQQEYRERKKQEQPDFMPAEKKTRAPNPEHKAFIDGWCQNYETHFGRKYAFDGGRDAKSVRELLSLGILRLDLLETAKKAWAVKPPTFHTGRALTIHGFRDSLNEIQNEITKPKEVRNMI